ncbi:MAG: kinase [Thermoplasmatales archaeon]|nr:kinase [Thermoplasmatales archaeon]
MTGWAYRARAPLRIGLAGGGTDVDPYASEKGGLVLNATIDKYAYCTVAPRDGNSMSVVSLDYGNYVAPLDGGPLPYDGNMDLIKAVTNHFNITEGFDMFIHSDAPPGSGLGGSSTVIVSIITAIAAWKGIDLGKYEKSHLAYVLEREKIGLKGGKQDQYAAAFGGFNLMEFTADGTRVRPLGLDPDVVNELQYCSLLCYTGDTRESAGIIESQVKGFKEGSNEEALDETKRIAGEMAAALEGGSIREVGEILDEGWAQKKRFSPKVTNRAIDRIYDAAKAAGAIGGKVSGAGGGGFMYFICEYDKRHMVGKELIKRGARTTNFMFEANGAVSWRARDD